MSLSVLILVGPTAIGKTELGIELAKRGNAEIISADSRQVYKFMDIGTAKPTAQQLAAVPHHFIDIKLPDEPYSAGQFGREARECVEDIRSRGKNVVVVGGSGLYIRGLVDGFFEPKVSDVEIKMRLKREVLEQGVQELYQRLERLDAVTAARLQPTDTQRILRALEVFELTGKPWSRFLDTETRPAGFQTCFVGLTLARKQLYTRIEARVDRMLQQGLLDEVRRLQEMEYDPALNALQTVGYKEAFSYIRGMISYEVMVSLIKQKTRNYAKRQFTWFRKDERIQWFDLDDDRELMTEIETAWYSKESVFSDLKASEKREAIKLS